MTIFDKFKNQNVLIIGDVMIDRYLKGAVNRISPEAPVPILELISTEDRLGGAANVALNIKSLGATPHLYTIIGDDPEAKQFTNLLTQNQIATTGILKSKHRKTTLKTRIVAGSQQILRLDSEDPTDLNPIEEQRLLKAILKCLQKCQINVIILQDYNKGVLTASVIQTVLQAAAKHNIPTAVDPKRKNFMSYQNATLFKPNLKEIRESLPFPITTQQESLREAALFLRTKMLIRYTMITLSEKGLYIDGENENALVPTQARNVADVSGAGDTVISVAALALAIKLPIQEIAHLANLAGGQVCEKAGVVPVDLTQLKKDYERLDT